MFDHDQYLQGNNNREGMDLLRLHQNLSRLSNNTTVKGKHCIVIEQEEAERFHSSKELKLNYQ